MLQNGKTFMAAWPNDKVLRNSDILILKCCLPDFSLVSSLKKKNVSESCQQKTPWGVIFSWARRYIRASFSRLSWIHEPQLVCLQPAVCLRFALLVRGSTAGSPTPSVKSDLHTHKLSLICVLSSEPVTGCVSLNVVELDFFFAKLQVMDYLSNRLNQQGKSP